MSLFKQSPPPALALTPAAKPVPMLGTPATVTVGPGMSLSSIAAQAYRDASKWPIIYNANKAKIGSDPRLLTLGQVLTVPPRG